MVTVRISEDLHKAILEQKKILEDAGITASFTKASSLVARRLDVLPPPIVVEKERKKAWRVL